MWDLLLMPSRLPRLLAATGLAVTVLTLAACSQQSAEEKPPAAPAAVPGSTAQFGDGPAPETTVSPIATATSEKPAVLLADGRWPGFIAKVAGETVSMDLVEFLTGDAAAAAWQKKYPDSEQDSPDNDYFIVNDNTKLRRLPLSQGIQVTVVGATGPGTEEAIAVSAVEQHFGNLLKGTLFWFTVKQGEVTKIEQQFLP
ncbi:hypothetical protein Aau02nite_67370 [Amorphoplanes auranticolor]|uniref:Lipoprotein n=2 Tax=Actinoplanes auranticolor TaxID=47988 RepID=A0A919SQK1_9ACTN|nr:hypothetical protein Aau02nite_67370 [Actinoplanes auranticolor]